MHFKFCLLLIAVVLLSCKKDVSDSSHTPIYPPVVTPNCASGDFLITENGVTSSGTNLNNTLSFTEGELGSRTLDLRATAPNGTLVLSITNWNWQNIPNKSIIVKKYSSNPEDLECIESNGYSYCDGMSANFTVTELLYSYNSYNEPTSGHVTITDLNEVEKKVSGNYEVTVYSGARTKQKSFSGTFDNLCYTILGR